MRTLTIANQKGGVGKTTLAMQLGYAAHEAGKRVLLVDMDPQASLTLACDVVPVQGTDLTTTDLFQKANRFKGNAAALPLAGLANGMDLIAADQTLYSYIGAGQGAITTARTRLQVLDDRYDLCIIDTPPERNALLIAALASADFVVTPMTVGLYERGGIKNLFDSIKGVRGAFNPGLTHVGILLMKTNGRSAKERAIVNDMRDLYGAQVRAAELPERAAVRHAVDNRKSVWHKPRGSSHEKAAQEWRDACNELIEEVTQ